jgi:acetyl-CoA acyltransferase
LDCRFYDELVVPVDGIDLARDESIRSSTTIELLSVLRTAFRPEGTITAGSASPLDDGASALVLGSASAANRIGTAPAARIAGRAKSALDPRSSATPGA